MRRRPLSGDDRGSAPVEFILVGTLLTVLTLGVLQLGLGVYVRNVVHDAAVEGAYRAALADTSLTDGEKRTRELITRAIGASYARQVEATVTSVGGQRTVTVTVRTPIPVMGLLGAPGAWEVSADAPAESLE
ncbi:TadE/TadG family type IV pilus assembly protein [Microbacterium horticulturae]|uniref:TadE/TadG family type IV pilus assembly protein n=1 Tax=Microbacterium horticulturae TaxID=3028316 RepID=A0ABY8BWG8_9MICO|nr:TadE/TadG family type IV pilus assembly protein [Microbacterium sp. KACC 23027]WEG07462.1 TadE/TadG family type IV pilus assembly protein [Microbacterium sp. KACC 23027]